MKKTQKARAKPSKLYEGSPKDMKADAKMSTPLAMMKKPRSK